MLQLIASKIWRKMFVLPCSLCVHWFLFKTFFHSCVLQVYNVYFPCWITDIKSRFIFSLKKKTYWCSKFYYFNFDSVNGTAIIRLSSSIYEIYMFVKMESNTNNNMVKLRFLCCFVFLKTIWKKYDVVWLFENDIFLSVIFVKTRNIL